MQQLQYDSYYKFIVSSGIALLVAPTALLLYLISGKEILLIKQEDMEALCTESRTLLHIKLQYLSAIYRYAFVICIGLSVFGCMLIWYGCKKWKVIQKNRMKDSI